MILTGHVRDGLVIPDQPISLPDGAQVRFELLPECGTTANDLQRPGGLWKGRVQVSEDFDDLPDDIGAAFGMDES